MPEIPNPLRMSRLEVELGISGRALLLFGIPLLVLLVAGLWFAAQFLHPIPPRRVVFAAGPEHGVLHAFAERYREILARDGVTLDVRVTDGAGDNLRLLGEKRDGAEAGFLVAGAAKESGSRGLVNLGNVLYAPLWVLYRGDPDVGELARFKGKRIATGATGSGLASVIGPLLTANGITKETSTLVELRFDDALAMLLRGDVDVAFLGEGPRHPGFLEALARPDIRLMDFSRADAYARRFPWLHALVLPAGTLDFERGLPARDLRLIGSTVMIAARESLHPTIVDLLVDAAREVHGVGGYFEARGEFPDMHRVDALPMSEQAVRYEKSGPSFLRRYLPLWLADFVQRLITLALPFLVIVLSAVRWIPAGISAWIGNRIQAEYATLRMIEREVASGAGAPAWLSGELDRADERAAAMRVPSRFAPQLFQLRSHIGFVRRMLADRAVAA